MCPSDWVGTFEIFEDNLSISSSAVNVQQLALENDSNTLVI